MCLGLGREGWIVSVISLNLKEILTHVKPARQHLIYGAFCVLLAVLVYDGLYVGLLSLAFFYMRFRKRCWIFFLIFGASVGWLHLRNQPPALPNLDGTPRVYVADIVRIRRQSDDRQTAIVDIDGHQTFMTFRDSDPRLAPGQTIEVYGRLSTPTPPTVPHRFNFQEFLFNQGIHLTLHTDQVTVVGDRFSVWQIQHQLGDWVRETFPDPTSSYLQSFFLGLRDDMNDDAMGMYSDLGILHIFAISGTHVTLLAGTFRDGLKRIGLIDVLVDGMVVLFCVAFVFIAGGSISIIRASSMSILSLINRRLKLGLSSFDVFALVFMACFIMNPLFVYQRGFQFSFWISFILICSRPTLQGLSPLKSKLSIVYLARMASIPLSVSSGFEVNVTSYVANLLLVPLLMQLIIPALLVVLFLPFMSPVTNFLLTIFEDINVFLHPILNLNLIFGAVPLMIVVLLMACLIISCFYYERHRKLWIRLALIGVYVLVLEGNRLWQPYSAVTFLDVGQGDATIIRSPYHSCTIVVDTGGDMMRLRSESPSIFSNTLEPYLLGNGVRRVDFLILTHEHYDHIAEAIPLMNRFEVGGLIISEAEAGDQLQAILDEAQRLGIPVHVARPLDTFTCGNQHYTFVHREVTNQDLNEDSLVMAIDIDGWGIMITGDIGHETEGIVLAQNPLERVDVYQVAHHGSRHSNSYEFMKALNIRYAVVQVGRRNFYGHPSQELLDVTDELGIPLLSNAVHGTVQFRLRNGKYTIHIWPWE